MPEVVLSAEIDATPEAVFETLTNLPEIPQMISGIERIEVLTDGPVGKGTKFRETRVMYGREGTEEMTITEFDRPNSFVLEAESHGAKYRTVHELSTVDAKTKLALTFSATPTNFVAKVMGFVMMPLFRKSIVSCIEQDLADLKQHLESNR